jgi:hypothetical protein
MSAETNSVRIGVYICHCRLNIAKDRCSGPGAMPRAAAVAVARDTIHVLGPEELIRRTARGPGDRSSSRRARR